MSAREFVLPSKKVDCILLDLPRNSENHQGILGEIEEMYANFSFKKRVLAAYNVVSAKHCCWGTRHCDSRNPDILNDLLDAIAYTDCARKIERLLKPTCPIEKITITVFFFAASKKYYTVVSQARF